MAKKISINDWLNRIDSSRKIYSKWHRDYKRWVQFFRGQQWSTEELASDSDHIVVNYVFNTIKTMVPTLYFKNPKIFAVPTRPEFQQNSEMVQTVINYDWRKLEIKNEMKKAILRALIGGLNWIETGYVFEVDEAEEAEDTRELTDEQLDAEIQGNAPTKQEEKFTEFKIRKDQPFAISRSILDVITDPFANVFEEMGWYAVREYVPIERAKKDPRFKSVRSLDANAEFDDQVILNMFRDEARKSKDLRFIELWHVTDRWRGKTMTIARGHSKKLREFDTPEGYNITPVLFNDDPEQPQPISVIDLMEDQQREKNKLRSTMLEHIKRTLPRIGVNINEITDEDVLNSLANSDMDELIRIPGDPRSLIQPINFPSIPADMFGVDSKISEDMTIASGLTDFQRGQAVKVPSATEAQIIEQSSRLRVDEGLDIVSDVASKISSNILKLRQKFTTGEQVIPIVGESSAVQWRTYTKDEIKGDYEFLIEYGSTQKRDQDFEKALWSQAGPVLSQFANSPNPADRVIGRRMAQAFEIPAPDIDKIFGPEQPMQQEQGPGEPSPETIEQLLSLGL